CLLLFISFSCFFFFFFFSSRRRHTRFSRDWSSDVCSSDLLMSSAEIRITAEPIDTARCKFLVSEPVHEGGVRRFVSPEEANGSPLVEAIFAIPGADVSEVIVSGNLVTVVKRGAAPWQVVGKSVGGAIRAALAGARPAVAPKPAAPVAAGGVDDDTLYDRVAELFEAQVNPMVARHGG